MSGRVGTGNRDKGKGIRHEADEARRLIKASAAKFLWEHPFREMTVAKIMSGTVLSRPSFYQYYKNVHHLIRDFFYDIQEDIYRTANPWLQGEGDPLEALRKGLSGVIGAAITFGPLVRAVIDAAPMDAQLEEDWNTFMNGWDDAVEFRIRIQQQSGLISSGDARRIAIALNRMNATVLVAEFGEVGSDQTADAEAMLETLFRIWAGTLYAYESKEIKMQEMTSNIS